MNTHLSGKGTAVITGASAGIGKVYANRLAEQGFDLLLIARRADSLSELAQSLSAQFGIRATFLAEDLTTRSGIEAVVAAVTGDATITMLVNNAGAGTLSGF